MSYQDIREGVAAFSGYLYAVFSIIISKYRVNSEKGRYIHLGFSETCMRFCFAPL